MPPGNYTRLGTTVAVMRAATIAEQGRLELAHVDDPTPGTHDLVVEVGACGICGSDLKVVDFLPHGYVMGHEFCGRVVATGHEASESWHEGDSVVALPVAGCGACEFCIGGEPHHCQVEADLYGVGGRPGAYAQYARVDGRWAFRLPPDMSIENGALVEPVAVGIHALSVARLRPDDAVLIVGGGPVGITSAIAARLLGAGEVVVSEPIDLRRKLAERCGASASIDPLAVDVADEFSRIAGRAPDVVVEAVGSAGMIQHCIELASVKGRVVVAGVATGAEQLVPFPALRKEVSMSFALFYRRSDFSAALRLVARGGLNATEIVTRRIELDDLPQTFAELRTPERAGGAGKVLVRP